MPEAPEHARRWFQFGLRTMFVVVTVLAIGIWQYSSWVRGKVSVNIATTGDLTTVEAMSVELANNGISSGGHGSLAWAVIVRRRDAARTRAILLNAPSLKSYQFKVVSQDWEFGQACPPLP
jgi:hypothetical protein